MQTPYYGAQTGIEALNRLMYRADAYCLQNSSCPFYGQGKGSVIAVGIFLQKSKLILIPSLGIQKRTSKRSFTST
jgi:hypothetical protein